MMLHSNSTSSVVVTEYRCSIFWKIICLRVHFFRMSFNVIGDIPRSDTASYSGSVTPIYMAVRTPGQ